MGYTFRCDDCRDRYDSMPPFHGEFSEQFLKTTGGVFAERYRPGQTITLCASCCEEVLL